MVHKNNRKRVGTLELRTDPLYLRAINLSEPDSKETSVIKYLFSIMVGYRIGVFYLKKAKNRPKYVTLLKLAESFCENLSWVSWRLLVVLKIHIIY